MESSQGSEDPYMCLSPFPLVFHLIAVPWMSCAFSCFHALLFAGNALSSPSSLFSYNWVTLNFCGGFPIRIFRWPLTKHIYLLTCIYTSFSESSKTIWSILQIEVKSLFSTCISMVCVVHSLYFGNQWSTSYSFKIHLRGPFLLEAS